MARSIGKIHCAEGRVPDPSARGLQSANTTLIFPICPSLAAKRRLFVSRHRRLDDISHVGMDTCGDAVIFDNYDPVRSCRQHRTAARVTPPPWRRYPTSVLRPESLSSIRSPTSAAKFLRLGELPQAARKG